MQPLWGIPPALGIIGVLSSPLMGCGQRDAQIEAAKEASALPPSAQGVPGKFDGTWQVESAGIALNPSSTTPSGCGSLQVKFDVKDSQISGGLQRNPYERSVENSEGRRSAPVTGTVQPDGAVSMFWERYVVTGNMAGDRVHLQWKSECGPREASGVRVASEGAGSTGSVR